MRPLDRLSRMQGRQPHWHTKFAWAALFLSFLAYPVLLYQYSIRNSAAFDESMHIAAGYRYWQCGDYGINPEHPPLLKLIAAFSVRHWEIGDFGRPCGAKVTSNEELLGDGYRLINSEHGVEILLRARMATFVFPLLLLGTIFFFARSVFGPLAAGIATLLTVFEPNLTAFGPFVLTDVAVAATTLLALALGWHFMHKPTLWRLLLLGVALGLALASKHSAIVVPFILLLEFVANLWIRRSDPARPSLTRVAAGWTAACAIAVCILWAAYGFRYNAMPSGPPNQLHIASDLAASRQESSTFGRALMVSADHHLLPESYLAGLLYVRTNSTRATYLLGQKLDTGVWYYFPVAISIKTTLTILFLILLSVVSIGFWRRYPQQLIWLWIPVAVFLLGAITTKMNIGIRHILPVYPFMVIIAAGVAAYWAERSRVAALGCVLLIAFQAVSYARNFPNEVAYANEAWGGPRQLHRYLGDSNVDVGQSLYRVRDYIASHHITNCSIAWFGMQEPASVALPCQALPAPAFLEAASTSLPPVAPEKISGVVFVSATLTDYDLFPYTAFLKQTPADTVDGSVLVFRGDFDVPQVAAERRLARGWWYLDHGQGALAIPELQAAEIHAQAPGLVHSLMGWGFQVTGQLAEAQTAYEKAAQDFAGSPSDAPARRSALAQAEELRKQLSQ